MAGSHEGVGVGKEYSSKKGFVHFYCEKLLVPLVARKQKRPGGLIVVDSPSAEDVKRTRGGIDK